MKILQPWRTRGSSTARWQQQHICNSISKGKRKDQSQLQDEHGEIAKAQNLQTKIDLSPYGHYNSQVRNHLYGVDENLDSITLAGFGSLLTKILFSYRSTEVYGILIVMKIPTERSRSWGLRSNPWLLIGDVREVLFMPPLSFWEYALGSTSVTP